MFDHGDGGARPEESIDDGDSVETREEDKEYFLQDPSNRKGICYWHYVQGTQQKLRISQYTASPSPCDRLQEMITFECHLLDKT